MSTKLFTKDQEVEAYTFGEWQPGRVYKVYTNGCDVIIGNSGCYYVTFENMREVK